MVKSAEKEERCRSALVQVFIVLQGSGDKPRTPFFLRMAAFWHRTDCRLLAHSVVAPLCNNKSAVGA